MPRNGFCPRQMSSNGKTLRTKKRKSTTITRNHTIKKLTLLLKLNLNKKSISLKTKSNITKICTTRLKSMTLFISSWVKFRTKHWTYGTMPRMMKISCFKSNWNHPKILSNIKRKSTIKNIKSTKSITKKKRIKMFHNPSHPLRTQLPIQLQAPHLSLINLQTALKNQNQTPPFKPTYHNRQNLIKTKLRTNLAQPTPLTIM